MVTPKRLTKEERERRLEKRKENEQNIKDLKFAVGGFFVIIIILIHYVFVMRQLLIKPDMSYSLMGVHFGLLALTTVVCVWLFIKFVYKKVYAEEIKELNRKKEQ
ncbi:hypothetical protein FDK38_003046 [Candidozyma auris]|nr:hypothetical protein FDK38_003046 [[Candida] auris]